MIHAIAKVSSGFSLSTRWGLALSALAIALLAVFLATPAHAQGVDGSPSLPAVDLSLYAVPNSATSHRWSVYVQANRIGHHPLPEVRDVKVRFYAELVRPGAQNSAVRPYFTTGYVGVSEQSHIGSPSDDYSLWKIPTLTHGSPVRARARVYTPKYTRNAALEAPDRVLLGQDEIPLFRVTAEIIGSSPAEPPEFEANNTLEFWFHEGKHTNGDVGVEVMEMSNRSPGVGGATTFTVEARSKGEGLRTHYESNVQSVDGNQFAVQVKMELSPGLTFARTQTAPSGTTFNANNTTIGIWDIGPLDHRSEMSFPVAVNLTNDSLADLPLEKRCLTAEVTRAVPWFEFDPWKRQNDISVACLGETPKLLPLVKGEIILFNIHDCVGVTSHPCTSADTVEILAGMTESTVVEVTRGRRLGRGNDLLKPEQILVHVSDSTGRGYDSLATSLTDGNTVSWHTRRNTARPNAPGVEVKYARSGFNEHIADWSSFVRTVTVSGLNGTAAPGRVRVRVDNSDGFTFYDPNPTHRRTPFSLSSKSTLVAPYFLEFTALGTYLVEFAVEATRTDSTVYTGSGTYTFHVGPMAELEVRDTGANPVVADNRQAYTVMAVNNGPDEAPAVRVTGLPTGVTEYDASQGEYDPGSGVWTIGKLGTGDGYNAGEGPTLTLITDDTASTEITAEIENTRDYCVRIKNAAADLECPGSLPTGYTEHSTHYYDYIEENNSTVITARTGTGRGHPDMPDRVTLMETSVANILTWEPVGRVNGYGVAHYEVQRSASPWETLLKVVTDPMYVDMAVHPGQLLQYRVRAVNIFGVGGPWSLRTTTGPDAPGDFTAEQLQGGEVRLTWTKPDGNGAAITGYTIQMSTNGGQSWSNTGARLGADDTSWLHGNLSVGPTRLYRIQARTANGHGAWAQATPASIAAPVLTADYDGASDVILHWTMPGNNAVPVLSYELQHSTDGNSWNRIGTVRASDGMTYTHTGRPPGATGRYRVRASTALGHSPWSEPATATTAAGAPRLTATANGPNEIVLTWAKPSGDAEIFEYRLERNTAGSDWSHLAVVYPEDGTAYVDGGLSPGATWSYRVRAVSIADGSLLESDWSAEASATTDSGGPDNAPTGLTATANGENRIDLSWTVPASGGGTVTGYRVEHSADGIKWERIASVGNATSYSHTGLMSGTTHHYRVAALSGGSAGPFSNKDSATTAGTETTVPGMPANLRVTSVDRNRVSIAWDAPEDDGGSRVTGYEYRYSGPCAANPADLCQSDIQRVSGTSASVTGLAAGSYQFEARAVNAVGAGEWADPVYAEIVPASRGRVTVTPDSLTVNEGGTATYRVKLSHEPTQPIQVGLFWEDPDEVLSGALAGYQGMLLLPSNYTPPEGAMWDGWAFRWNVGIPIVVDAVEDDDAENGTAVIHHDVWTAPADLLGNPEDWAEDPVYHGMTGPAVKVTVRDND